MIVAKEVAIVVNEQTPYRLHLHRRIVREMPEVRLWSLFTHQVASSPWRYSEEDEIGSVMFGAGESSALQGGLGTAWREWCKGGEIIKWLRNRTIAAIILFGYNDPARVRVLLYCKSQGIPCFLFGDSNVRGPKRQGLHKLVKSIYVRWFVRNCAGVFHCGVLGREYFLSYGAESARLYPFPYEPNYELILVHHPNAVQTIQDRFHLDPRRRRFLFVGRLVPIKRPDLLLEAFELLANVRPEWDLVIAGDGALRQSLRSRPVTATLAARINWTGFMDSVSDIAALYALCDVLVLPSDYEPWGVVVAEAATRLALVASSTVGAAADLLKDGLNGRFFEPGNLHSLHSALMEVSSSETIDRMKAASPRVLATWRAQSDPVANLRLSLRDCGVLS